jgi:hypothetical protein
MHSLPRGAFSPAAEHFAGEPRVEVRLVDERLAVNVLEARNGERSPYEFEGGALPVDEPVGNELARQSELERQSEPGLWNE